MPAPRPQPLSQPKRAIDDVIADALEQAQASGELASAKSWGKPLDLGDGYDDTPAELRLPMKILKDAGVQPYEVTLMHRIAELRAKVDAAEGWAAEAEGRADQAERKAAQQRLAELQQDLALRLERLRATGAL